MGSHKYPRSFGELEDEMEERRGRVRLLLYSEAVAKRCVIYFIFNGNVPIFLGIIFCVSVIEVSNLLCGFFARLVSFGMLLNMDKWISFPALSTFWCFCCSMKNRSFLYLHMYILFSNGFINLN